MEREEGWERAALYDLVDQVTGPVVQAFRQVHQEALQGAGTFSASEGRAGEAYTYSWRLEWTDARGNPCAVALEARIRPGEGEPALFLVAGRSAVVAQVPLMPHTLNPDYLRVLLAAAVNKELSVGG